MNLPCSPRRLSRSLASTADRVVCVRVERVGHLPRGAHAGVELQFPALFGACMVVRPLLGRFAARAGVLHCLASCTPNAFMGIQVTQGWRSCWPNGCPLCPQALPIVILAESTAQLTVPLAPRIFAENPWYAPPVHHAGHGKGTELAWN